MLSQAYYEKMNPAYKQRDIKCLHRTIQMSPKATHHHPDKLYLLFMDASIYYQGTTLFQYTCKQDFLDDLKPITFISGKFSYTQCIMQHLQEKPLPFICLSTDAAFAYKMQNAVYCVITNFLKIFFKRKRQNNKSSNWTIELFYFMVTSSTKKPPRLY